MTDHRLLAALGLLICFQAHAAEPGETPGPAPSAEAGPADPAAAAAPDEAKPDATPTEAPAPPDPLANASPELRALAEEVQSFSAEIEEYRRDARRLIEHNYTRRRREVQQRYAKVLGELTEEERRRRDEAIARFEEFLARYPANARYTPDALFRLAELHFEKSNDAYLTGLDEYDELLEAYDAGRLERLPPEPVQDYGRTIELFERLITQFPNYRNLDGAYYLKGYCLMEMDRKTDAIAAFRILVDRFPQSRFAPETWTRIGEHHFEQNELPEAIDAYKRVLAFPDSPYYDKALYKLAWTYYRDDQYESAIARFRELIEFSDAQAAKKGGKASELRAESIQYLAISLQEDDWDGDGEPDPGSGFERILKYLTGEKPYEVEVLRAIADILFDNARYEEAIATIRHLLRQFPTHADNPTLHAKMITAYERLQRIDDAFSERDALARAYGTGSAWRAANENKPEALQAAEELLENALISAATWHHSRAQALKQQGGADDEAVKEYRLAAVAYDQYLERYPRSENAYDLSFFFAECLYYASRFSEAGKQYAAVRDNKAGDKYRETAAFSSILAYEHAVRRAIDEHRLESRPSLLDAAPQEVEETAAADENDGTVRTIEPETMPEEVKDLQGAREVYLDAGLRNADDATRQAKIAYKAGETYFDYKHFDEARRWFSWLIQRYPKEDVAGFAASNIIETYRQANDWKKMAEWAEVIAKAGLGRKFDEEIRTLKVGALFKEAERLFAAEDYDRAAEEYIRLVTENPGNKFADAALNNAAVAYEKTRRFESATRTYERIYRDYPDSQYAENALFRVGVNAERFYDYDKSIQTHLRLVERYPNSTHRADSLYQAALLQEQTQQYAEAAKNYERYARLFPDREDTAETWFRAGRVYARLNDAANEARIYESFAKRYGADPKQNARVIEGLARLAEMTESRGRTNDTKRAWLRVIDEFNRRGLQPGAREAQYPARAVFTLVELDFERYRALRLTGSLKNQGRIIQEMQRSVLDLTRRYTEVVQYKSFDWTLAAFYRLGHIYQLFAEALYEAPIPDSFDEEQQDLYRSQLEDIALPIEDEAVKRYETAFQKAREFRVTNEWTQRIQRALNKYKPSDYPLFKQERRVTADRLLTPGRLLMPPPPEGAAPAAPAAPEEK